MDKDERTLVRLIKEKDQEALEGAIDKYGKLVLYIISKIFSSEKEKQFIDDCYNEIFTTLWFNIDCFDEEKGNLKSWIIGIAKYKALEFRKKCLLEKTVCMGENFYENGSNDSYEIETNEDVMLILDKLEEKDRGIFLKRYIEGYSVEDIAQGLGVTRDYIYNRISRGKKKIKTSLKEVGL
jgi:RNA polymerase sigma-70 factor (ECF subfamily)